MSIGALLLNAAHQGYNKLRLKWPSAAPDLSNEFPRLNLIYVFSFYGDVKLFFLCRCNFKTKALKIRRIISTGVGKAQLERPLRSSE